MVDRAVSPARHTPLVYGGSDLAPPLGRKGLDLGMAPDLQGIRDTDVPEGIENYTDFHIVGDLVALLDAVALDEAVFVVGHDWGANIARKLSLYRPDKVEALVNLEKRRGSLWTI